jgi:hypothetical protein
MFSLTWQAFTSLPDTLHPLHRALYIHFRLGAIEEMRSYYKNNRLPQVRRGGGVGIPHTHTHTHMHPPNTTPPSLCWA